MCVILTADALLNNAPYDDAVTRTVLSLIFNLHLQLFANEVIHLSVADENLAYFQTHDASVN